MKADSTTPYLIRGLHEWATDNGLTPQIGVKVDARTQVPAACVKNGEIILNISCDATRQLKISNDFINFSARFSGVSHEIAIPIDMVFGIFAKETGQGMAFEINNKSKSKETIRDAAETKGVGGKKKPRLQFVK